MNQETLDNKGRCFSLYRLALERIDSCKESNRKIIPFPKIFLKLCGSFAITKKESWEILFILRDFGLIEIIPHHGVKIKERGKNDV